MTANGIRKENGRPQNLYLLEGIEVEGVEDGLKEIADPIKEEEEGEIREVEEEERKNVVQDHISTL